MEKLSECLKKLEVLRGKPKEELLGDTYLQDIVERNFQVLAQAIIDIANRIISLENLEKPRDYYEAILRLGHGEIVPADFAKKLAPLAGFRNILVHDYLELDWDEVYANLQRLGDIHTFLTIVKAWLSDRQR